MIHALEVKEFSHRISRFEWFPSQATSFSGGF